MEVIAQNPVRPVENRSLLTLVLLALCAAAISALGSPEHWLAVIVAVVGGGAVLLASPVGALLVLVVVMQFGTASEWLIILRLGGTDVYAFDLVLLIAAARIMGAGRSAEPLRLTAFHGRVRTLISAVVVWSLLVQLLVLFTRGPAYFGASTATFTRAFLLEGVLVFLLAFRAVRSREDVLRIYGTVLVLGLVQALFGLFQAFVAPALGMGSAIVAAFSSTKFTEYYGTGSFRAVGFIGSGRELAGLINMVALGWLGLAFTRTGSRRRRALFVLFILLLALLRTLSKFEYIVFAAAVGYFAMRAGRMSWKLGLLLLLALVPALLPETAVQGFEEELAPGELAVYESSVGRRLLIWRLRIMPLITASPVFGHGWGAEVHDVSGPIFLHGASHNQYLQWWVSIGIVGLVLIVSLLIVLFKAASRLYRHAILPADRVFAMGYLGAVLTLSLSAVYSDMFNPGTGTNRLFWLLTGLFYAYLALPGPRSPAEAPSAAPEPRLADA